jgi:integrase
MTPVRHTGGEIERLPSGAWRIRKRARNPQTGARYVVFEEVLPAHWKHRQVQARLAELLNQAQRGELVQPVLLTVRGAFEQWMNEEMATRFRTPKGRRNYEDIIAHWNCAMGDVPVQDLSMAMIQRTLTTWQRPPKKEGEEKAPAGVATDSVNKRRMVVRAMLDYLKRRRIVAHNEAELVPPLKCTPEEEAKADPVIWSLDQTRAFLTYTREHSDHGLLYAFIVETGLREAEALAVRDVDLNPQHGWLLVRQTMNRTPEHGVHWGTGKTKAARRRLAISAALANRLKQHLAQRDVARLERIVKGKGYADLGEHGPLVFCQDDGKPLHAHNIARRDFHLMVERAKLPVITLHALRHISRTLMADLGIPDHIADVRMGHARKGIAARYTHALDEQHQDAARRIGEALYGVKAAEPEEAWR